MNPDQESTPKEQNNNPPIPQDNLPPQNSPGGVIRPAGTKGSPPLAETPAPPQPQNTQSGPSSANPPGYQIFPPDSNNPGSFRGRALNKRLLLIIIGAILLVLLIAGYIFAFYLPNKPENAYKTGLDRSGDALQMILDKATEQQTYDKFKKSEITASMEVNSGGQTVKGDLTAKFDDSKLDTDLSVKLPATEGSQPADLGLSILSEKAEGKEFPDTYFNLRGINALGADLFLPGIGKYDGKWVEVSSDYVASLASQYGVKAKQPDSPGNYPTFDEISSLIRDVYGVTNEYVLTSDSSKAVLVNKQYLGKEDVDGVNSFHYEVGIDKGHFKAYCEAVSNALLNSAAAKKFMNLDDKSVEQEKQKIGENCQKDSDAIKDDTNFEMWIDSKYKLIKKVRSYYTKDDKGEYYELGQNYDGSDKVSFFFATVSDKGGFSSKTTITTDLNIGESSAELTFSGGEDPGKYDGKITLNAKPLSEEITITKPKNVTSVSKLLKDIGIDPKDFLSFYGDSLGVAEGANSQSEDALIKSNINSIYSNLEVYYASNGYYPTEQQLSDQNWRASNMPSLSEDVFSTNYTYSPSRCSAGGCQKYSLSAKLNSGQKFMKNSSF